MKRVPEPEIMDDLAEVVAYDELVSDIQGEILDRCFAKSLANIQTRMTGIICWMFAPDPQEYRFF